MGPYMHCVTTFPGTHIRSKLSYFITHALAQTRCLSEIFRCCMILPERSRAVPVKLLSSHYHRTSPIIGSTLVQVFTWCHPATNHEMDLCWPWFISPCDIAGIAASKHPPGWQILKYDVVVLKYISFEFMKPLLWILFMYFSTDCSYDPNMPKIFAFVRSTITVRRIYLRNVGARSNSKFLPFLVK